MIRRPKDDPLHLTGREKLALAFLQLFGKTSDHYLVATVGVGLKTNDALIRKDMVIKTVQERDAEDNPWSDRPMTHLMINGLGIRALIASLHNNETLQEIIGRPLRASKWSLDALHASVRWRLRSESGSGTSEPLYNPWFRVKRPLTNLYPSLEMKLLAAGLPVRPEKLIESRIRFLAGYPTPEPHDKMVTVTKLENDRNGFWMLVKDEDRVDGTVPVRDIEHELGTSGQTRITRVFFHFSGESFKVLLKASEPNRPDIPWPASSFEVLPK